MKVVDSTIKYSGKDFPELGIRNGMSYDVLLNTLLSKVQNNKSVNLLPIEDKTVTIEEAISYLLNSLGKTTTDDIKYNGKLYFDSGITSLAIPVLNKNIKWETSLIGDNIIYSFNFSEVYDSLPDGYYAQDPRTRVSGLIFNGSTIIRESSSKIGTLQIPFDRLPASAETEIRVLTSQGDLILRANVTIASATKGTGSAIFEVKDYSSNKKQETNLTIWGDLVSSKIAEVVSFADQIKKFSISGLKNVKDQSGLMQVIGNLSGELDTTITNLNKLNTVLIPGTTEHVDIQTALNYLSGRNNSVVNQISDLSKLVNTLKKEVETLTGNSIQPETPCVNCGNDNVSPDPYVISYSSVTELTDSSFSSFISNDLSVVMFYNNNCSDCVQMEQVLLDLAIHYGISQTAYIGKININTYPSKGTDYSILQTPTYIIFGNGSLKEKTSGVLMYSQLKNKIDTYL